MEQVKKEFPIPMLWIGWDKETLALCNKAVEAKRDRTPNEDIPEWAERLAKDVCKS